MPANVVIVEEVMSQIVNFQLIDKEVLHEKIVVPIFGSKEPGKEQGSSMFLQLFLLMAALILIGLLIAIIVICRRNDILKRCPRIQKLVDFIKAKLMFNSILRTLLQAFLQTCITMWIALAKIELTTMEGLIDFTLAVLTLIFSILFPVVSLKFLRQNENHLREPAFKAKYDSIYQNVDYYKEKALVYSFLFLGRRLLFAFVIVNCGFSIVLQVLLADILNTLLLCFFIGVRPMIGLVNNVI